MSRRGFRDRNWYEKIYDVYSVLSGNISKRPGNVKAALSSHLRCTIFRSNSVANIEFDGEYRAYSYGLAEAVALVIASIEVASLVASLERRVMPIRDQ